MFDTVVRDEALMQGAPVGRGWFDDLRPSGGQSRVAPELGDGTDEHVLDDRGVRGRVVTQAVEVAEDGDDVRPPS